VNQPSDHTTTLKACTQLASFRDLNESECQQVLEIANERTFAPGEPVIEQGGRSEQLWILLEGKCDVIKASTHDGPLVLAQLDPHNLFGEMSFFSPAPHSASVVAKTHVRLLSIARQDYDKLLAAGSLAAYKLAYNVVQSLAHRLRHMDDWVAELAGSHHPPNGHPEEKMPEWHEFRKRVLETWNL
jgi:CRP-like cAMP-binding protein